MIVSATIPAASEQYQVCMEGCQSMGPEPCARDVPTKVVEPTPGCLFHHQHKSHHCMCPRWHLGFH